MLAALSIIAYLFFARSTHDLLEPLLGLPEGQAAYAAALRRIARTIALFDLPVLAVVGVAAYVLARFSVGPLLAARTREERFAADAAHELRTPLATIAALAQAARLSQNDNGPQGEALRNIAAVALEASGLIGDLLVLMRDAPADERLYEPVDIAALLTSAVNDIARTTPGMPITLTQTPNGAYIVGDVRALRQLIANLLSNALNHARAAVTAGVRSEQGSVVLWVDDDGAGVAPADRDRIFERFYKAQRASPGSGLGLAICRHIATRHHGTLQLEGRARFVARFPRAAD